MWGKAQQSGQQQAAILGMRLGGGDYSYLIQDNQINVLKNTRNGVQDLKRSFTVKPSSGAAFTPSQAFTCIATSGDGCVATGSEDGQMGHPLQHGKFSWVTEGGKQERWIVASCGGYTVLWNFKKVREAKPDHTAFGGLTVVTDYHLIQKDQDQKVVDSVCIPERHSHNTRHGTDSMVIVTDRKFWSN
ncbi:hypothetical protein WJX84_005979 [Apatococcus fuscideae]|uniref:Vacuolar import/degradation Vid27 C-terminal domain-containing protein n=1 Tax=Apatococcus fuscideae TaxID=2026836 RepID=A0AAW1SLD1_9CHLO